LYTIQIDFENHLTHSKGGIIMNKTYQFLILMISMFILLFMASVQGQTVGDIMWEDHFDDPVNDFLLNNVGWLYFGEEDDLVGQQVAQTAEGKGWIKCGVFSSVIGASIIETNGFSHVVVVDGVVDFDSTETIFIPQNANINPNQEITFEVNFLKISLVPGGSYEALGGTFFLLGTRMFNMEHRGYGNPIEDSTYVLIMSPLGDWVNVAKFSGELAVLNPAGYTYFGDMNVMNPAPFDFDLNVPYWVRFYLYEGDLKVKIWEGDLADGATEPWLIEVTDPDPWVRGDWTEFGLLGDPVPDDGDEMELDDIVVREVVLGGAIGDVVYAQPDKFELAGNYPNPFNPETTIEFTLDKADDVTLKVFSISGQLVATIISESMEAGSHQVTFNGRDNLGNTLSSGIYFYQLQSGEHVATQKMILMK
jgi:hypothetical protein